MRIGLLPGSSAIIGGAFQYSISMVDALDPHMARAEGDELVLLLHAGSELDEGALRSAGWEIIPAGPPLGLFRRRLAGLRARRAYRDGLDSIRPRRNDALARWLREHRIELMLYPVPTSEAFEARVPYVLAVHDLQHRLQPEFPEVSADGQAEAREYVFRNGIANAATVLVDSETGKEDVLDLYSDVGIAAEQVVVLPFPAPPYLGEGDADDVHERYGLPDRYLFYPAQFWPHKNHVRLVEAIAALAARGVRVPLVFSGTHSTSIREETHAAVLSRAEELGVADLVHDLGYVPGDDMAPLYRGAVALAMPTFFGPTNIPVIEAWALGCPVITSDIRGIREHVGEAGLLADPRSTEAWAVSIQRLWSDETLRRTLAERGRERLADHDPERFRERLLGAIAAAKEHVASSR